MIEKHNSQVVFENNTIMFPSQVLPKYVSGFKNMAPLREEVMQAKLYQFSAFQIHIKIQGHCFFIIAKKTPQEQISENRIWHCPEIIFFLF